MTTFDRYLLSRYFHVCLVFLIATIGLFVVVDGFVNLDEFQKKAEKDGRGDAALFLRMGEYYLYQSALLVELAGPTVMVISAMSALALMLRAGEIHPLLAAGVPAYRVTRSLLWGILGFNALLIANQELLLPRIAHHLQGAHGDTSDDAQQVNSVYDPQWRFYISGKNAIPATQSITGPEFRLPAPRLAHDFVTLTAAHARFLPANAEGASGWLLEDVAPAISDLHLTELGRQVICPQPNGRDVFVASTLTFDMLCRRSSNFALISTRNLFSRLQQPTGSLLSRRALLVHLHGRLTRPLLSGVGLFLVIPLILRRERMSPLQQMTNMASCAAMLGLVFGASMGAQFLGTSGLLSPEQSVWAPLVCSGGLAGWLTGVVRT